MAAKSRANRRALYEADELRPLIAPASVAVVGASLRPTFATAVLSSMKQRALPGGLHVVTPIYPELQDVPAVPATSHLPEGIDCVVIGTRADRAVEALRGAAERGAKAAFIHASGFAESGGAGVDAQREITSIARASGIRVCGPNALGLVNFVDRTFLCAWHEDERAAGPIGIVSQSGGLGRYLTQVPGRRLFSHMLCCGNAADVDPFDLANYLLADATTRAVAVCVEAITDVERLLELGDRSHAAGKAVVMFKSARTAQGARAAQSHTGSLVGSHRLSRAAIRRAGIVEVDSYEDLVETSLFFARAQKPKARGVGVITAMGGVAVSASDAAERWQVPLPDPSGPTRAAFQEIVPDYGTIANPVDLTFQASGPANLFETALRIMADDPAFGVVVLPMAPVELAEDRPRAACRVAETTDKTIAVYWVSQWLEGPGVETLLADDRVTVFRSIDRLFSAVASWQWWHDYSPRLEAMIAARRSIPARESPGRLLDESEARDLCAASGVAVVDGELAVDSDQAVAIASRLGYPVVLKGVAPGFAHKSDAGAVRLDIRDEGELRDAFDGLRARLDLDGVLVTSMITDSVEVMVSAVVDPLFGPVVTCGLGGIFVEVFDAPELELAPVDAALAAQMVRRMRGSNVLREFRGRSPRDTGALVELIVAVSRLVVDNRAVQEVELNPVMVREAGVGACAVDVLVSVWT